jgi:hypothetical protein
LHPAGKARNEVQEINVANQRTFGQIVLNDLLPEGLTVQEEEVKGANRSPNRPPGNSA